MRRRLIRCLPALGLMLLIFTLSSQGSLPIPKPIWSFDKVLHFGAFFVLATLWAWGLEAKVPKWALAAAGLASLYGATDEVHQAFVPGRSSDVWDWMADTLGALAAAGVWLGFVRFLRAKTNPGVKPA